MDELVTVACVVRVVADELETVPVCRDAVRVALPLENTVSCVCVVVVCVLV